jgi:hypothetical protein
MIGAMPSPPSGMPCAASRRTVLRALGAAAAAAALSGCGIRLEDDAPRVPLVPTREPVPGEGFLVELWLESEELGRRASAGAGASLSPRLAALHTEQARVLRELLLRLGVPQESLDGARAEATSAPLPGDPTTSSTPAATPSGTVGTTGPATPPPSPTARPEPLGPAEAAALVPGALAAAAGSADEAVPLAAALLAQRAAAATLLGEQVTWPQASWSDAALAAAALDSTRAAVYGFEVVSAQSAGAQRALATAALATLQARAAVQERLAGDAAAPPPLGYPLPFPVATPAAARRLAGQLLTGLRADTAAGLLPAARSREGRAGEAGGGPPETPPGAGPLSSVVQWLADTEVLASRWGLPLQPFPGLA